MYTCALHTYMCYIVTKHYPNVPQENYPFLLRINNISGTNYTPEYNTFSQSYTFRYPCRVFWCGYCFYMISHTKLYEPSILAQF